METIITEACRNQTLSDLVNAHHDAAIKNLGNISSVVVQYSYQGSGNVFQAISAGVSSLGGRHAPVIEARKIYKLAKSSWYEFQKALDAKLKKKERIAGFGNSFFKGKIDPSFEKSYQNYLKLAEIDYINTIKEFLNEGIRTIRKKESNLFPNAAIITAAICEELNLPDLSEVSLMLQGRLSAWTYLISKQQSSVN